MRILFKIKQLIQKIKFAFQRAFRGYDDTAYWGLNIYLAEIIVPVLENMNTEGHGYPSNLSSVEEWHEILDKMIIAFKLVIKEDYEIGLSKEEREVVKEGLKLFAKYYRFLWD